MLVGVSSKESLFSCPSHVHLWFVDSLALTAETGFLTDRVGDRVPAAAGPVGAGACMDALAQAKPKRRRRLDSR